MSGSALHLPGLCLLVALSAVLRPCAATLYPEGAAWTVRFDPPYDDSTLRVQLKMYDWWTTFEDVAVLPKGTQLPIVEDDCAADTRTCRQWTVPGDVVFTFGPPTIQDAHRLSACWPARPLLPCNAAKNASFSHTPSFTSLSQVSS